MVIGIVVVRFGGFGFGGGDGDSGDGSGGLGGRGGITELTGVIGSEKRDFFEDPAVIDRLDELGYTVTVETAGSRHIATDTDLSAYDFAFPSSAPAARSVAEQADSKGIFTPFYSPMAVASFQPVMEELAARGVTREEGGTWWIDMQAYLDLTREDTRWRDLGDALPSQRTVQISTTDVRTSNSAAMYLALMCWVASEGNQVSTEDEARRVADGLTPLFYGQGYTESSSAGPFADYLSKGMGAKPMVMVYEAQFLGKLNREQPRLRDDMVLAYPEPTVLSDHTVVALSDGGAELGRLLENDAELQRLAAEHGFRTSDPAVFTERYQDAGLPEFIDSVDPPDYHLLETLIETVGSHYTSPEPPEGEHEE